MRVSVVNFIHKKIFFSVAKKNRNTNKYMRAFMHICSARLYECAKKMKKKKNTCFRFAFFDLTERRLEFKQMISFCLIKVDFTYIFSLCFDLFLY